MTLYFDGYSHFTRGNITEGAPNNHTRTSSSNHCQIVLYTHSQSKLFTSNHRLAHVKNRSPQEAFWAGSFGDDYSLRNKEEGIIASNIALFSRIMTRTRNVNSIIEFGANIGLNLIAINKLMPRVDLSAVEINKKACKSLEELGFVQVYCQSIFEFTIDQKRDFTFSKGVLIHINPSLLNKAYEILYNASNKYICICEYYNPTPLEVTYRGYEGKLFKRDFSGEMMEKFPDLKLIDYGFVYHHDPCFPQDDITWFLMEKDGTRKDD